MVLLLSVIIALLVAIIAWLFVSKKKQNQSILKIANKISDILDQDTAEKVLVPTGTMPSGSCSHRLTVCWITNRRYLRIMPERRTAKRK